MQRRIIVLVAILLLSAGSLSAQFRGHGGFPGGRCGFGGFGSLGGFGGFGGYGAFSPGPFAPSPFDYGFGYGGYGYYPAHFPPYPYPALLPQQPQYTVMILEATHDWRYWSPTTKVIVGPVADGSDSRLIGMGVPQWAVNSEPLGDVARRNRVVAAGARPEQRAVYRFQN